MGIFIKYLKLTMSVVLLLVVPIGIYAQITGPEQNCNSALPVCGSLFQQPQSYIGAGNEQELLNGNGVSVSNCLQNAENNSVWYIFTVTTGGMLEFSITPASQDDYDFALFNITGGSCNDIGSDPALEVRCSYSLSNGLPTGIRAGGSGVTGGPSSNPFLLPLSVSAGETYALVVDNFSQPTGGYTLDFTTSTASIVDNTAPLVVSVVPADGGGCNSCPFTCDTVSTVTVFFSEPIICGSIDPSGSEFTITGPSNLNVIGADAPECAGGAFATAITLQLDQPIIIGGTYTVSLNANALEDNCGNQTLAQTFNFDVPDIVLGDFSYDLISSCVADTFDITNLSQGNFSNVDWDFGDNTTSTQTDPVHVFPDTGNYIIEMIVSSADCADTIVTPVSVSNSFTASIDVQPLDVCPNEIVDFENTSMGTGNQYFWDFGDNTTSTDENTIHAYANPGTYDVIFVLTDNSDPAQPCSDTVRETILVREQISASFNVDQNTICQTETIQFTDASTGAPISWAWDFGDNTTSTDQNPSHVYDTEGALTVKLVVQDEFCGEDSITTAINVISLPIFNLGSDTAVCFSESVILTGPAGVDSYAWSTGETDTSIVFSEIPDEVTLEVSLNGCSYIDTVVVGERKLNCAGVNAPGAFSPNGDGKNDVFNVVTKRIDTYELSVYNRWGQLIFRSNRFQAGWDGTFKDEPQELGTYVYVITATGFNGEQFFKTGNVTLIR